MRLGMYSGAEVLVRTLVREGVIHVFGTIGSHILPIYDALYDEPSIKTILVRHEENAAVMADVYGRLTGRPGVCLVTAGPGATNTVTGVAEAFAVSSPLVHISGTVSASDTFHAVGKDPLSLQKIYSQITKSSLRIDSADSLAKTVTEAFDVASTGKKGPVHLEIPLRVQKSRTRNWRDLNRHTRTVEVFDRNFHEKVRRICSTLEHARQPVIFAGVGVLRDFAFKELLEFAEANQALVVVSNDCVDVFSHNHRLFAGYLSGSYEGLYLNPVVKFVMKQADVLLLIGTDLETSETRSILSLGPRARLYVGCYSGSDGMGQLGEESVDSIKRTLTSVVQNMSGLRGREIEPNFAFELIQRKQKVADAFDRLVSDSANARPIHPAVVASTIRRTANKNAIVTVDVGSHAVWVSDYFTAYQPLTYFRSGEFGSMGFAVPAAIAAKIVRPDQQVIAITGDGGFAMSLMELATSLENEVKITVVVMNDSKYGIIWQMQRALYRNRHIGVDLMPADFSGVARGFGAEGIRVEDPKDLAPSIGNALKSNKTTVIDVLVDHRPDYACKTLFKRATSTWSYRRQYGTEIFQRKFKVHSKTTERELSRTKRA